MSASPTMPATLHRSTLGEREQVRRVRANGDVSRNLALAARARRLLMLSDLLLDVLGRVDGI